MFPYSTYLERGITKENGVATCEKKDAIPLERRYNTSIGDIIPLERRAIVQSRTVKPRANRRYVLPAERRPSDNSGYEKRGGALTIVTEGDIKPLDAAASRISCSLNLPSRLRSYSENILGARPTAS